MKMKKFAAALLSAGLLVAASGCTAADADDIAYKSAGIRRDKSILTVDGREVTAEKYLFWLTNTIAEQKYYGKLSDDDAWEENLEEGVSTAETLKGKELESAKLYRVIETKAEEYGVTPTEEQTSDMEKQLSELTQQIGGEDVLHDMLGEQCITEEAFRELNSVYYLNTNLQQKLSEDGLLTVSEEELQQYMERENIYAVKHILLSTRRQTQDGSFENFDDSEKAEVLAKAKQLRLILREEGDSESLFDDLMKDYSDDGRDENGNLYAPDGYTFVYPGQMVSEFENAALALKIGEISDPIESSYGYHIILRIKPDEEEAKETFGESYKYSRLSDEWCENAAVKTTKAYDRLDPHDFYLRLQDILKADKEARESVSSEAESSDSAVTETVESPAESPAESPIGETEVK